MSTIAAIVFVAIILPVTAFLVWFLLQDAFVRIAPGQMGLSVIRGKPSARGMMPGMHFTLRFGRVIEIYPSVELAYLTESTEANGSPQPDELTLTDPPLRVTLGDRTAATLQYTIRFTLTPAGLPIIHRRFGTSGIKGIVRDESRRVILVALAEQSVSAADAFGPARSTLEERVGQRVAQALADCGFAVALFNLREMDLLETGEVIQSTLRAREELERERATGAVRVARAQQEAEVNAKLADSLSDAALDYLRIQVLRELVQRWDGRFLILPGFDRLLSDAGVAERTFPAEKQGDAGQSE